VSFFEQYVYGLKSDLSKTKIIEKKLLNKQTLELLHRMVYQRYSTYKNTVKLFLPQEIDKLIDRKTSKINHKSKKHTSTNNNLLDTIDILDYKIDLSSDGQILIVFPDLRSLINLTTKDFRNTYSVDVLLSSNTQNQKDKSRRNIKL
jgi:primosomal protein N'